MRILTRTRRDRLLLEVLILQGKDNFLDNKRALDSLFSHFGQEFDLLLKLCDLLTVLYNLTLQVLQGYQSLRVLEFIGFQ